MGGVGWSRKVGQLRLFLVAKSKDMICVKGIHCQLDWIFVTRFRAKASSVSTPRFQHSASLATESGQSSEHVAESKDGEQRKVYGCQENPRIGYASKEPSPNRGPQFLGLHFFHLPIGFFGYLVFLTHSP